MIILTDIHGCFRTMQALIAKCPKDDIVICGDLIDRGPRSMEVVDYVINNNIPCVKGNHELMMVNAAKDFMDGALWENNGGIQALNSYIAADGTKDVEKLKKHREWMDKLPIFLEFKDIKNDKGEYLVVSHSSIGKVWQWDDTKRKLHADLFESVVLWGRGAPEFAAGIYNVFGHTPHPVTDPRIKSFYANIDSGACFSAPAERIGGYGVMTALQFPSMQVFQQENID